MCDRWISLDAISRLGTIEAAAIPQASGGFELSPHPLAPTLVHGEHQADTATATAPLPLLVHSFLPFFRCTHVYRDALNSHFTGSLVG